MVLGNYVIKDMGGKIEDAFNGIGPIYHQWQLLVSEFCFYHRNNVGENFKDDFKEAQVQKSIKYWKLGFHRINCNFAFVFS